MLFHNTIQKFLNPSLVFQRYTNPATSAVIAIITKPIGLVKNVIAPASNFIPVVAAVAVPLTTLKAVEKVLNTVTPKDTAVHILLTILATGDIDAINKATVTIDGADIKLDGYTASTTGGAIASGDTVNAALSKLEYMLSWHEA